MLKYFISIKDQNQTLVPVAKVTERKSKIQMALKNQTEICFYLCVLTEENKKQALHELGSLLITKKMQKKNPSAIIIEINGFNDAYLYVTNKDEERIFSTRLSYKKLIKKDEKQNEKSEEKKLKSENSKSGSKPSKTEKKQENKLQKEKIKAEKKALKQSKAKKTSRKGKKSEFGKTVLKVRHPLGLKLIVIISIIVGLSLGTIIFLVNYIVSDDVQVSAEENNFNTNTRAASDVENRLENAVSSGKFFINLLKNENGKIDSDESRERDFFNNNPDIAMLLIPETCSIENKNFFLSHELDSSMVDAMLEGENENLEKENASLLNVSPYFPKTQLLAIISPSNFISENQKPFIILYSPKKISDSFASNHLNFSFVVNEKGIVLAHGEEDLVFAAGDMSRLEIVSKLQEGSSKSQQLLFTDQNGKRFFGAYTKLSMGNSAIVTMIAEDTIFESIRSTTRRNIYLSCAVLAIAILVIWFFSKSISKPIKKLAKAAKLVQDGQYDIHLKAKHKDEIGLLTTSFVQMGKGLAERERLKDTFGRFTNKAIAEKAMKGELVLGGETKNVTVFFSDIRNFTAMSEKLSPEEVVSFLNAYMTRMVECVNKTGGTVDKFIGDAIMAVWGAPISDNDPKKDALNAVRAALYMRSSLAEFNALRIAKGQNPIRIGCGINSGSVVAGQIGSNQRMEYTCIGDTVNLASRTEALNKPFATDILITGNTYSLVKEFVTVEKMLPVTVKGKEKPIDMYAVVNMKNAGDIPGCGENGPLSMHELRKRWGIQDPDLKGINTDDEEKKFNIKSN